MDAELATRNNVISEYKTITAQLSEKLEKAQKKNSQSQNETSQEPVETNEALETANSRIRELELELAQTKLALVETECKFQDLSHQFASQAQVNYIPISLVSTVFTRSTVKLQTIITGLL